MQMGIDNFWLYDAKGNFFTGSENGGILEQFTGFTDCTGKDIYEGDVMVDVESGIKSQEQVFWCKKKGGWRLDISYNQNRETSCYLASELRDFKYKIVGHIHDKKD